MDSPVENPKDTEKALREKLKDGSITEKEYVAKMAETYDCTDSEAFQCDKCGELVEGDSIALCPTCEFRYGLCEACYEAKVPHDHPLVFTDNLWNSKFDMDIIDTENNSYFLSDDMMTLLNLGKHPLTTEIKVSLHPEGKEKGFRIHILNQALTGGVKSDLLDDTTMVLNYLCTLPETLLVTKDADCKFLDEAWKKEY